MIEFDSTIMNAPGASETTETSTTMGVGNVAVGMNTSAHQHGVICRICLLDNLDMRYVFSKDSESPALSDKAMSFACVKVRMLFSFLNF